MRTTVLIEKIGRPAIQLVAVAAAAFTHDIVWVALAWAIPYLPAAVVSARDVQQRTRQFLSGPWPWPRRESDVAGAFVRYSFPRALSGVASLALQRLDIVLVDAFKGPTDAALYTAATRFLVVGQFLGQSIQLAMQPRVSALLGRNEMAEAQDLFRVTTAWLVLLTWPLYVSVAVFPHVFLTVFGHSYAGGATVVVILALSMLMATITGQVDVMVAMGGRSWLSLANVSLSLLVNVVLNLILIPRYGIVGAAISWSAAIVVSNTASLTAVRVAMHMHPFGRASLSTAALAAACFGLPGLTRAFGLGLPYEVGAYLVGCVAYLAWLGLARNRLHLAQLAGAGTARFSGGRGKADAPVG
jgi:O-antigen/teichoic acid export membrane protein